MKKTVLMLIGFAVVLGAAIACFTPSSSTTTTTTTTKTKHPTTSASPSR